MKLFLPLLLFVFSFPAFADVIPVPEEVISEKIQGAKPRNVVFILSDDQILLAKNRLVAGRPLQPLLLDLRCG